MSAIQAKDAPPELVTALRVASVETGLPIRDLVLVALAVQLGTPSNRDHRRALAKWTRTRGGPQ